MLSWVFGVLEDEKGSREKCYHNQVCPTFIKLFRFIKSPLKIRVKSVTIGVASLRQKAFAPDIFFGNALFSSLWKSWNAKKLLRIVHVVSFLPKKHSLYYPTDQIVLTDKKRQYWYARKKLNYNTINARGKHLE